MAQAVVCRLRPPHTGVEQVEVIPHLVHLLKLREAVRQAQQLLLGQTQVLELVLEDDASMEQTVLYNQVALSHLILREGNLQQIVFSFVGIVGGTVVLQIGQTVGDARQAVSHFQTLQRSQAVCNLLILLSRHAHHRLVHALPVVHVLALAPLALEGLLTLRHGLLVVEVPLPVIGRRRCGARRRFHCITLCTALLQLTFRLSLLRFFALLLFLLLQGFDNAVDGCITVLLVHLRQLLQRVLQMDGVGIGHEFVEHL